MDAYLLGVDCLKVRQIHCITLRIWLFRVPECNASNECDKV
jgi:hypothetical protein